MLPTCISCGQACRVLQACETSPTETLSSRDCETPQLSWDPLCQSSARLFLPGHKSRCRRSPSRKARRGRMVKRSVLLPDSPHTRVPLEPLTAPEGTQRPCYAVIAHRQPISVCDQHIVPAAPPTACLPACFGPRRRLHARACVYSTAVARQEEGRRCLTALLCASSLCASVSPYNVAVRHYAG